MHKTIIFLLFIFNGLITWAQKHVINDPNVTVRNIDQNFSAISVTDGISIYISQASQEAIAVSAIKEEYKDAIKTEIENGRLKIYFDHTNARPRNKKLKVYLSLKSLTAIEASGAASVYIAGNIRSGSLQLNLSETSLFKGTVNVDTLFVKLNNASDAAVKGVAGIANVDVSGASDLLAYGLITSECNVKSSGASDVNITVNKILNVHASGAGTIKYKGNATIVQKQLGNSSSIIKKED